MQLYVPRRHRRKLLFPPGLLALAGLLLGLSHTASGQVKPRLTARVDTSQSETRAVYELLGDYLNSRPDSLYTNPFWNTEEVNYYFTQRHEKFDLAAQFLFFDLNAKKTFGRWSKAR